MRPRLAAALAGLALALACAGAQAGMVEGPYLIWINLANDASADQALHDYTHLDPSLDSCWNGGALLLIGSYPAAITPELARRAAIAREPAAQRKLRALLRTTFEDFRDGYDGVVVVPAGGKPRLVSFGSDGKVRTHSALSKSGAVDWPEAFCEVMPPIRRKP
jgi:hypothetical protein